MGFSFWAGGMHSAGKARFRDVKCLRLVLNNGGREGSGLCSTLSLSMLCALLIGVVGAGACKVFEK